MSPPGLGARALDGPLGVVAALPTEHGAREHVVEDLPAPRLVPPQDAVVGQDADDAPHLVLGAVREQREIGHLVGDLHPRRSHKMVEKLRRDPALLGGQRLDRTLEVIGDDLTGATKLGKRRSTQRQGSAPTSSTSHSLCMTSWRYGASIPGARPFVPCTPR